MFWRRSSQVGQSLKLGSRPSQAFPRGAAAADDDGRRLADCVGYVCTYPTSQMDGLLLRTTCNSFYYQREHGTKLQQIQTHDRT